MEKMKNFLVVLLVILLFGSVYGGPAASLARADAEASCDDVDDNSFCDSTADDDDDVDVAAFSSETEVDNDDAAIAISGMNFLIGAEDSNEQESGGAGAFWETLLFTNQVEVLSDGGSAEATNEDITDHSDGDSLATDNDEVDVTVVNHDTDVDNSTSAIAVSGGNFMIGVDDGNHQKTGGSGSLAASGLVTNGLQVSTGNSGSAHAKNKRVDDHSFADAKAHDDDAVTVDVKNSKTKVKNKTFSTAVSGMNFMIGAEDGNRQETGMSQSEAQSDVFTNVVDVLSNGSAEATNEDITDHSDGDSLATDNDDVDVKVVNHETDVDNSTSATAVSGGNFILGADDGNSQKTGSARASGGTVVVTNGTQVSY